MVFLELPGVLYVPGTFAARVHLRLRLSRRFEPRVARAIVHHPGRSTPLFPPSAPSPRVNLSLGSTPDATVSARFLPDRDASVAHLGAGGRFVVYLCEGAT